MTITKRAKAIAIVGACVVLLAFTPMAESVKGLVHFMILAADYGRQEKIIETQIAAFTEQDYRRLVDIAAKLVATPPTDAGAPEAAKGIPPDLAYLRPQRVWVSRTGVSIAR